MRLSFVSGLLVCCATFAQVQSAGTVKFEKDVLPIFTQYCFTCHGKTSPQLGLDLRTAASTMRGSQNGPMIIKGSPENSVLFQQVSTHAMPPPAFKAKLPDAQIETIRAWIAGGALSDQPAGGVGKDVAEQRQVFEKELLPMFQAKCVQCHGAGKPMSGLDLRTFASMMQGGK